MGLIRTLLGNIRALYWSDPDLLDWIQTEKVGSGSRQKESDLDPDRKNRIWIQTEKIGSGSHPASSNLNDIIDLAIFFTF